MPQQTKQGTRVAGPVACENCAKAKSKCLPGPTDHLCQRKVCISQTPAPRREKKGKRKRLSRADKFERRLEELSARLDGHKCSNDAAAPSTPNEVDELAKGINCDDAVAGEKLPGSITYSDLIHTTVGATHGKTQPPAPFAPLENSGHEGPYRWILPRISAAETSESIQGPQEDALSVQRYRNDMQPLFPFVVVQPDLASPITSQMWPFLWRAVKLVASDRYQLRSTRLADSLLRDIAEAIVLRPRQDIDLIQGLLVLIAWYHWALDRHQINNLLSFARSLCDMFDFLHQTQDQLDDLSQDPDDSRIDLARAYCGWYYLSTVFFTIHQTPSAFSSSSLTIRNVCAMLASSNRKQFIDDLVVCLTRIQQFAQSILVTKTSRRLHGHANVPLIVITSGFRQHADKLRTSLPAQLMTGEHEKFVRAHLLMVEIMIHEIAISDCIVQSEVYHRHDMVDLVASLPDDTTDRAELLSACIESVQGFLTNYTIGSNNSQRASFLEFVATLHCYKLLSQLISLHGVFGWSLDVVRDKHNISTLLERATNVLKEKAGAYEQTFPTESAQNSGNPKGQIMPPSRQGRTKNQSLQNELGLTYQRLCCMLSTLDGGETGDIESVEVIQEDLQGNQDTGEMGRESESSGVATNVIDLRFQTEGYSDRITEETTRANVPSAIIRSESDPPWPMNPAASSTLPTETEENPLPTFGGTFPQITLWPRILP
ncbi:hypothetical protein EDB81DRAFT_861702 [Dactylonectria macrodidyma]|uniref:Zn(2)-C6 fungal-type domain-containing protein n=1 Tax=Dactylonectria macrodidyma TaxID=307937 RepID=A0A9P9DK22_9HYPO|nr:hypothetical protein EDB81DRAFT_861702 [Dactylonectria macrodidyma]